MDCDENTVMISSSADVKPQIQLPLLNDQERKFEKENNHAHHSVGITFDEAETEHEQTFTGVAIRKRLKNGCKKACSVGAVKRRFPFLRNRSQYDFSCLAGDIVAGLTVGLMVIPQSLAYGLVAGLSPTDGMYASIAGGVVYFLFGSINEISVGPTAITALLTFKYSSEGGVVYAVMLCFLSGCIEILAGLINLGFLINFISKPVISGFTSAASITIASSQLKPLFGLSLKTHGLLDTWIKVCSNLGETRWPDLVLGLCCIVVLVFMKQIRGMKPRCIESLGPKLKKSANNIIFFLSVGRNAIVVIAAALIAFSFDGPEQPFNLTGEVKPGLPSFGLPAFSTTVNNVTKTFPDIISDIGIGIFTVPFIAILNHIAVASAMKKGNPFDANQEIIALGLVNVIGSFLGAFPNTAGLSKTAVNKTSGVRTTAGGILTTLIVVMALAFLTSSFRYIPKATLAAVIISAVLQLLDYEILKPIWKSSKIDLVPLIVTFLLCLSCW